MLQRFIMRADRTRTTAKLQHAVKLSRTLQVLPGVKYDLVGVCRHNGTTMDSGHYVSIALRGSDWWYFNDAAVPKKLACVDASLACDAWTRNAHVLLYASR